MHPQRAASAFNPIPESSSDLKQIAHKVTSMLLNCDAIEVSSSLVGFLICFEFSVLFFVEKNLFWVMLSSLGAGCFLTVNG